PEEADLLVVSWGGTYGSVRTAVLQAQRAGKSVAHAHIRYLSPFPRNLGDVLKRYKKVIVPELNCGQLRLLLRSQYLVDAQGVNKIKGKPFLVSEIREAIEQALRQ
ncbi:2-oxoglutarate ferredoxin oxidoreductase subunit alpha, partial [bacterium]|nr:2-oxoglutarate ferredoxin oxidoreductase subunit alpha [bacterium]